MLRLSSEASGQHARQKLGVPYRGRGGKTDRLKSLRDEQIGALLDDLAKPARIASISANGFPLISTVWFLYERGSFWCITQKRTLLRRNLARNPSCAFEIALEGKRYKLMRGQGVATLDLRDGARLTNRMIKRYLDDSEGPVAAKMRAQIATEYAVEIRPRWVSVQGRP